MLEKFVLKRDDERVGILEIDTECDLFLFFLSEEYAGELPQFLQYPDSLISMNEKIKLWVMERAPEPNYEFIDSLLERANINTYDPYLFFKYNEGKFITDRFHVEPVD